MVWYIWASLGILAIVFEIASPTFFALFIGLGFLGSALFSYFIENSLILQILIVTYRHVCGCHRFQTSKSCKCPCFKSRSIR